MKNWLLSLGLGRREGLIAIFTMVVLVVAFLIFNNLSISYARSWDIEYGYIAILLTFILFLVGVVVNIPYVAQNIRTNRLSGKSFCRLAIM